MKQADILQAVSKNLGIEKLNAMQHSMLQACESNSHVILLSPTGTGKTLAFLIPLLKRLSATAALQAVILAPSRELAVQIQSCLNAISAGKVRSVCCYGGHNVADESRALQVTPQVLVGTPGRILDHINRKHIDIRSAHTIVLDEFDKSLELGFHDEMKRIINHAKNARRKILTSATAASEIPEFVGLNNPKTVDFSNSTNAPQSRISLTQIASPDNDKLLTLLQLLHTLPYSSASRTIVFVNYREAVERVAEFLHKQGVTVGIYHGALEQLQREMSLELFTNGTHPILIATDLAARGLDIASVEHIIHYHLPNSEETFTHRNGRTARVDASGKVFVITSSIDKIPEFIKFDTPAEPLPPIAKKKFIPEYATLYFMAGKKEKISKGDILGFLVANSSLEAKEIGNICVKDHYTLVAINAHKAHNVLGEIASAKIKNKKVRISIVK